MDSVAAKVNAKMLQIKHSPQMALYRKLKQYKSPKSQEQHDEIMTYLLNELMKAYKGLVLQNVNHAMALRNIQNEMESLKAQVNEELTTNRPTE